jgi:hypothetical protein
MNFGDAGVKKIDAAAEHRELLADLADRGTIVAAEVSDRLDVRRQPAGEPDQI